jgi:hypothetical protein
MVNCEGQHRRIFSDRKGIFQRPLRESSPQAASDDRRKPAPELKAATYLAHLKELPGSSSPASPDVAPNEKGPSPFEPGP